MFLSLSLSTSVKTWLIFIILEDPLYFETSEKLEKDLEFHVTFLILNFSSSSATMAHFVSSFMSFMNSSFKTMVNY